MSEHNPIKVTIGETETVVVKRETLTAKINRGLGYAYGGILYIMRNTLFLSRLKTKSGAVLRTKSGAHIITSRTIL